VSMLVVADAFKRFMSGLHHHCLGASCSSYCTLYSVNLVAILGHVRENLIKDDMKM
jgi:hypothetical protein